MFIIKIRNKITVIEVMFLQDYIGCYRMNFFMEKNECTSCTHLCSKETAKISFFFLCAQTLLPLYSCIFCALKSFLKNFNYIIIIGFDTITNENDISLLKLHVPVIFTDYVIPACLPTHDDDVMVGLNCSITGWGNTEGRN